MVTNKAALEPCTDDTVFNSNSKLKQLEEHYKGRKINAEELKGISSFIYSELKDITRFGNIDRCSLIFEYEIENSTEKFYRIFLFTHENRYCIQFHLNGENGYIGASYKSRKSRVGEYWPRGNDLPDGKYSKETFDRIKNRILSTEFKNLQIDLKEHDKT